jgi:ABC-2 type transport system ATP-binding protein
MVFYADLFGVAGPARDSLMGSLLRMTRMEPFRGRAAAKLSGGMKQKLALMCTLLHHPQILFLDEPTNGVDPVSRRDFWAILYQLVKDGLTVFVTTAYLDEAERCGRVGLLDHGRLIRCDSPVALRKSSEWQCYEVRCERQRAARERLAGEPAVLSVETAGETLHVLVAHGASTAALEHTLNAAGFGPALFREIQPSLEDVFIAEVRKGVAA